MRKRVLLLTSLALSLLFVCVMVPEPNFAQTQERPNIVFILTDDQDVRSSRRMPNVQSLIANRGVTLTRSFVTTSQCCPSRASLFRGQYAHNHGVANNVYPDGGYQRWRELGRESNNLATWMNDAGYVTAYGGKYMNEYNTLHVPRGWDRWWAFMGNHHSISSPIPINDNGTEAQTNLFDADYLAKKGSEFIHHQDPNGPPWFLVLAPFTPHTPYKYPERYEGYFPNARYPKTPSFNEADISDKPRYLRARDRFTKEEVRQIDRNWRDRLRGLSAVDDMVGEVMVSLRQTGQSDETYVVFTSDNGFMLGEHRWVGKGVPFEESIGVPTYVRGPGVPQNAVRSQMFANIDWAPTIASWANVDVPTYVDGRDASDILSSSPPQMWRKRLLLELFTGRAYRGIRTADNRTYVEHDEQTQGWQLYNMPEDPYQLENVYSESSPTLKESLAAHLEALKGCARDSCRAAES